MTKTNFAAGQLRSFVNRILTLKIEQDELGVDIREVYKEAHSAGFDKNVIGQVVQRIRKEDKNGIDRMQEADAVLGLYLDAYKGGIDGEEGNRTTDEPEPVQRPPQARRDASKAKPLAHAGAGGREEPTPEPTSSGAVSQAGEGAAASQPPPADHSYDPMTGELDPGPMPAFLRRKGAQVAA